MPIYSAECERIFSQMNLNHTSGTNTLLVTSVNDLLLVGINGPPLEVWNAGKYVISWLKSGHRSTLDKATGLPKKGFDCEEKRSFIHIGMVPIVKSTAIYIMSNFL
jgi:hypothetical protein